MQKFSKARSIIYTIVLSILLLSMFLLLLSGCGQAQARMKQEQQQANALPNLITKLKAGSGVNHAAFHPHGSVYFTSRHSIHIISGESTPINISPPPLHPSKIQNLGDIAVEPRSGLVYSIDGFADGVHVISNTAVVTTIVELLDNPLSVIADKKSGEIYVFYIGEGESYTSTTGVELYARSRTVVISETSVITDFALPSSVKAAKYNPFDGYIYAAGTALFDDEISVGSGINTLFILGSHQVITTIQPLDINPQLAVLDMIIDPDNGDVYILLNTKLVFWDRVTLPKPFDFYAKGYRNPSCITVDPTRGLTYVCVWTEQGSYVLAMTKDGIEQAIPVPARPESAAWDRKHDYVYIGHYDPTYLSIIRGTEVITTLDIIGFGTSNVVVDEVNDYIYTANADDGSISVFGYPNEEDEIEEPSFWDLFLPFVGE